MSKVLSCSFLKMVTLFFLLISVVGCARNESSQKRAVKGGVTSGAVGLALGGPQRAAISAVAGATARVVGGKVMDNRAEQE